MIIYLLILTIHIQPLTNVDKRGLAIHRDWQTINYLLATR